MVPYELLQDLNRLVCSSKNKKIESLFIKLASADENSFCDWILRNHRNSIIEREMSSPVTLDGFHYLIKNQDSLNDTPTQILFPPGKVYLELYVLLALNMDHEKLKLTLLPFNKFLIFVKRGVRDNIEDEVKDKIMTDVSTLFDMCENERLEEEEEAERLEEERLEEERLEEERVHHERISLEEMHENNPGGNTHQQMRSIATYRFAFGYLAQSWTNLIKDHIQRQNSPEYWSGVMNILNSYSLHRTGEVLSSLPYIPDMRDSGSECARIFARIPGYFQMYGKTAAYNLINRDIFGALKMPTAQQTGHHQDDTDYSEFYELGRDPNPEGPTRHDEDEEEEELDEMASEDVLECSFIFFTSMILAQIEELIKQH